MVNVSNIEDKTIGIIILTMIFVLEVIQNSLLIKESISIYDKFSNYKSFYAYSESFPYSIYEKEYFCLKVNNNNYTSDDTKKSSFPNIVNLKNDFEDNSKLWQILFYISFSLLWGVQFFTISLWILAAALCTLTARENHKIEAWYFALSSYSFIISLKVYNFILFGFLQPPFLVFELSFCIISSNPSEYGVVNYLIIWGMIMLILEIPFTIIYIYGIRLNLDFTYYLTGLEQNILFNRGIISHIIILIDNISKFIGFLFYISLFPKWENLFLICIISALILLLEVYSCFLLIACYNKRSGERTRKAPIMKADLYRENPTNSREI